MKFDCGCIIEKEWKQCEHTDCYLKKKVGDELL